jgi:Zn-dependent protease
MLNLSLTEILQVVPAILLGLTVHEVSHAFAALRLGDDTAQRLGRLTLNPIKHIDPVGFILLLLAGFGWAKPVVINRDNLRKPARDDILIALAGPFSNLLAALVLVVLLRVVFAILPFSSPRAVQLTASVFLVFISINVALGLFNLLPIPPLDGSHLVWNLLARRSPSGSAAYFRYGSLLLLGLILAERITGRDILPIERVVNAVVMAYLRLVGMV